MPACQGAVNNRTLRVCVGLCIAVVLSHPSQLEWCDSRLTEDNCLCPALAKLGALACCLWGICRTAAVPTALCSLASTVGSQDDYSNALFHVASTRFA